MKEKKRKLYNSRTRLGNRISSKSKTNQQQIWNKSSPNLQQVSSKIAANQEQINPKIAANQDQIITKYSANQLQNSSKSGSNQLQNSSKLTRQKCLSSWSKFGFTLMTWTNFVSFLELHEHLPLGNLELKH